MLHGERTVVWEEEKGSGVKLRNIGFEAVKVKSYGKVRTQYFLARKCNGEEMRDARDDCDVEEKMDHVNLGEVRCLE